MVFLQFCSSKFFCVTLCNTVVDAYNMKWSLVWHLYIYLLIVDTINGVVLFDWRFKGSTCTVERMQYYRFLHYRFAKGCSIHIRVFLSTIPNKVLLFREWKGARFNLSRDDRGYFLATLSTKALGNSYHWSPLFLISLSRTFSQL